MPLHKVYRKRTYGREWTEPWASHADKEEKKRVNGDGDKVMWTEDGHARRLIRNVPVLKDHGR
jgi:hypothetical protein